MEYALITPSVFIADLRENGRGNYLLSYIP